MMPASKHGDPQLGVDIHLCVVPPSPSPVPLPTPHLSVVFDPFDYIPYIGATVTVCGMKRATAGTNGTVVHIPPGFPFAPKLPDKDDEIFMGSSTVVADGDPFSFIAVPVLGCQVAGMISIPRLKKKGSGKKLCLLPTTFNVAIPSTVFVGGPPTISLMGMAFKGAFAALGKFAKSGLFKRMRQKAFGFLPPGFLKCKVLRAEPVNILTGEVSVEQEDFALPGRIPIKWSRSYSSASRRRGFCGYGWETPADGRLEIDMADGTVLMHYPAVGPLSFARLPAGEGDDAAELELMDGSRLSDHGAEFRVRTKQDRVYHFSKHVAGGGNGGSLLEYPLSRVSDLCGNWLEFERHASQIISINESAGRRVVFDLVQGRISAIALHAPDIAARYVFVSYEYEAGGDLTSVIDPLGHPYRFAYDEHHLIRHTDRNGLSFYYEYDQQSNGEWRVVHAWGDGNLYNYRFEYLDVVNERRITDSLGYVSLVKLDERGLPINEIDPLGGMTTYEYDDAGRAVAVIDPALRRTGYDYDERGNLLTLTRPDGTAVASEFDADNKPVGVTDPNGGLWQQRWDPRGMLLEQRSPLGHASRYEYDERGQLITFINPRGGRTRFGFDGVGNLTGLVTAKGDSELFIYDPLGNVTTEVDALNRTTVYRYDLKSRLVGARLPSGATITCAYDPEDNLIRYIDQIGAETRLEYFGQGEIARRILPDGHSVQFHYDTEERQIGVTNERGETYQLTRDGLGRIVEEVDYWGQVRSNRYDASGYLTSATDPLGRTVNFATDLLGRVLTRTLPDGFGEHFAYDANGNVVEARNAHCTITRQFDAEGHLVKEEQDTFTVRGIYDANGNRTTRETSDGNVITYECDALDQVVVIGVNQEEPIRIERDSGGRIAREKLSPHLSRQFRYSADGFLTEQAVSADESPLFATGFDYDATGNLTRRSDSQYGTDAYRYDLVGRITQHLDPQNRLTVYLNDAAGDRLRTRIVERARRRVVGDSVVADGEWSREGEYDAVYYSFDRAGNLVERRDEQRDLHLTWDANERLVESHANGITTRYGYDAFGRRLFKETGGRRTSFRWDGDALVGESVALETAKASIPASEGKVVAIADRRDAKTAIDQAVREYVYYPESFEPLALIEGVGDLRLVYYYHNDPNGCPTRLTDASGEVKWAATYTAWGAISTLHVDAVANPLRLQGQYEDGETGLSYNRHRFFDPQLGAFISFDPVGLDAGANVYEYASSATVWIDPLGLKKCNIKKTTIAALGDSPPGMHNAHMHHIVMEGAFSGWSKKNRSLITQARTILRNHNINIQGKQNVVWAQNAGHSVEYAKKVLAELKKAEPLGRQGVVDALDDIGKKLGSGSFLP